MAVLDKIRSSFAKAKNLGYGFFQSGNYYFQVPGSVSDSTFGLDLLTARSIYNAHRNPVVFSVVDWLADQVKTTPFYLVRTLPSGDTETALDHPLIDLLTSPNAFHSGTELLAVSTWDMLLKGQCFWHKGRIRAGAMDELTYLPAGLVEVKGTRQELITQYVYRLGNGPVEYFDPDEIVHIRIEPNPFDPKNGMPPLIALARALMVQNQSTDYTSTFLTEAGAAGGFLMPKNDEVFTSELANATRKYIHDEFKGTKRGTLGVLRAAMDFVRTTIDPKTAGTDDTQQMVTRFICGVFRVHPSILGLDIGSNAPSRVGAALKELERAAWTNRVIPIQDTIAEQIGRQLLPEFIDEAEVRQWALLWDRSKVYSLQPDLVREAQQWDIKVKGSVATVYEARVEQGMEADDSHKVFLVPSGFTIIPETGLLEYAEQTATMRDNAQAVLSQAGNGDDDEGDEDGDQPPNGNGNGQQASRFATMLKLHGASLKVEPNAEQRQLLLVLGRDYDALEAEFSDELVSAFEDLGRRAVVAFWEVEGGQTLMASNGELRPGTLMLEKQTPEEIANEVNRIMQALSITAWEQAVLIPAWDGHTLRTLNLTVGSINSTLGLNVNIPDPVSRNIIEQGGIRRGLVDFDGQTRESLFRVLREGRELGEGPIDLARRIQDQVPAGRYHQAGARYRAQMIARTETGWAANVSAEATYRQADVFIGVYISDGDYDGVCAALNGQQLTWAEFDALGEDKYLAHPNCVRSLAPIRTLDN